MQVDNIDIPGVWALIVNAFPLYLPFASAADLLCVYVHLRVY